jgi:hypothetical protein
VGNPRPHVLVWNRKRSGFRFVMLLYGKWGLLLFEKSEETKIRDFYLQAGKRRNYTG